MRAYRVAYDGRPFFGFQRQPDVPTVEGELLAALSALDVTSDAGTTPPGYAAAGRTDRGVSAMAQTVAFEAPDWLAPRALNGELPAGIRAWASAEAPEGFHATREAAWREYAYHLYAPDTDLARVRAVCARLEGTRDFRNLTAVTGEEVPTTRTVHEVGAERDGAFVVLRVRADGFLHEMVRRIVTLVEAHAVGVDAGGGGESTGDRTPSLDRVLSGDPLPGPLGIGPAPAEPLVLTGVGYPDLTFERDPEAAESLEAVFEARRVEAATRARVMGTVRDGARDPDDADPD